LSAQAQHGHAEGHGEEDHQEEREDWTMSTRTELQPTWEMVAEAGASGYYLGRDQDADGRSWEVVGPDVWLYVAECPQWLKDNGLRNEGRARAIDHVNSELESLGASVLGLGLGNQSCDNVALVVDVRRVRRSPRSNSERYMDKKTRAALYDAIKEAVDTLPEPEESDEPEESETE
jgi:hypothetical protein